MRQPLTSQAARDRPGSAQSGEEMQPAITSHPQEAASDIPLSTQLFCKSLGINYFVSHKTDGQASWVLTLVLGFGHQSKQAILPGPIQASSVHSAHPTALSQHHPWTGAKKLSSHSTIRGVGATLRQMPRGHRVQPTLCDPQRRTLVFCVHTPISLPETRGLHPPRGSPKSCTALNTWPLPGGS